MKTPRFGRHLALLLSLSACTPAQLLNATISRSGITVTHNVAYGTSPREKLDIYRPDGSSNTPVIVFFYGGSWNSGSKAMYPFVAATLARRGYAVVVPDYRLYPEVRFPAFLEDSAKSVAWTQAHLAEIGGDPSRVFLMGHSAGAYNAVMLGLDASFLKAAGSNRDSLAGIIGLAGPYDFLPITGEDIKPIFASVNDGPESQPISYVDGHAPPMLLLAGADDTTVFPKNTISLAARITSKGGSVQSHVFPGLGHIGLITAIAPIFQGRAPVLATVTDFISTHQHKSDAGIASRAGAPAAD